MSGWSANSIFSHLMQLAMGMIGILFVGCAEDLAIRQYTVEKSEANRSPASVNSVQQEQLMLGAIVPNKETTWFFKMLGPPADVSAAEPQFREMINSIQFGESGDPTWKLASGWTEQRTGGITFAKLLQEERGVSATVTQLASPPATDDASWQTWVIANVNRWRGQMSLAAQDWGAMKSELEELQALNQGEARAYYVSLRGTGSGQMGGPFSGGPMTGGPMTGGPMSGQGSSPIAPPAQARAGGAPELTYTVPSGWESAPASGMRMATFKVTQDDMQAEVTVISAGGDDRSNVARWQRQLLPDADEAQIDRLMQSAERFDVGGVPAELFMIKGAEGPEQAGFIAAIVPWQSNSKLFVKFIGPAKLAEQQRESFTLFVKSLKW